MPERILDRHVGGNTTYARSIEAGLLKSGIDVGRIRSGKNPFVTIALETMAGLRSEYGSEILHYVADTGPLLRTKRPSVVTVHGVASRWISSARTSRQEAIWRTRVKRAIASTDHVITVSKSSAEDISEVFSVDESRITVIPHGIDMSKFAADTAISSKVQERIPSEFVLYLGNIEPRKNLVELIGAFDSSNLKELGVPLVIAGKPAWNSAATVEAINRSSNVINLGFVSDDDRAALMRACSLFAFPSLYEGFGFPVLEALASGTAVITSNRGSLAEVAGPALRFESLDRDGIAEGLTNALEDPLCLNSVERAGPSWASTYSWGSSVLKHIGVYERLMS